MKSFFRVVGSVLGITILGILATVLVVWVYSTFMAPGKPLNEYKAFANVAGPWVSVLVGPLVTYLVLRMATSRLEPAPSQREALWIMGLYLTLDLSVLLATGTIQSVWLFATISALGRCTAAWFAVRPTR
ncbi:MAG: hypothetical protein JNM34_04955 [Chthonomonadaceae bacterium]|nr:hypothetical protein [Chthonomonadaceae bacterium]